MRKKIEKDEEYTDGEVVESWSKKRILIGFVVLIVVVGIGYTLLSKVQEQAVKVLGVSAEKPSLQRVSQTTSDVRLPTKEDANMLLERAKAELNNLTPDNASASDGALQRVIQDLQSLQKGRETPVGVICDLVCKK